jgi:hypothetical protein
MAKSIQITKSIMAEIHGLVEQVAGNRHLLCRIPSLLIFFDNRDTAGMGGKGGPYRLDSGHPVYQLEQKEKDAVDESVKRAAREMAKVTLHITKKRRKEII